MKASHVLLVTDTSGSFIKLLLMILDIYYELLDHMSVAFLAILVVLCVFRRNKGN